MCTYAQIGGCSSDAFNGLRQGDLLAPLPFKAIVNAALVGQGGTIFNKMTQVLACSDDVIIGKSLLSVKEAFRISSVKGRRGTQTKT